MNLPVSVLKTVFAVFGWEKRQFLQVIENLAQFPILNSQFSIFSLSGTAFAIEKSTNAPRAKTYTSSD